MKNLKNKLTICIATGLIGIASSITAFAAGTIKSVKINIKSDNIAVGKERNIDDVQVSISGSNYSVDSVDFMEMGTAWEKDDEPKITVHLVADDNYYFKVNKKEDFKITGGEWIESKKQNSSRDLYVDIKLPSLKDRVFPVESVSLNEKGQATWRGGNGRYQIKLIRGNYGVGGIQEYTSNTADLRQYMTKAGTYMLKVRTVGDDTLKTTLWISSNTVNISTSEAEANAKELAALGAWRQNNIGWWYALSDGSYVTSSWKNIDGNYYYFNSDGYMLVGWQFIDGNWYYMDMESGKMLVNTTTPDGYFVGISGAYSESGK